MEKTGAVGYSVVPEACLGHMRFSLVQGIGTAGVCPGSIPSWWARDLGGHCCGTLGGGVK